ncbi:type II toxin-antitoxin system VapC family toxin [Catalinimonas niigatensis]|uniref:type II toxin-antitoxin system VapC family toxin n=1 Tax=Catalinimonas niigatensis TaxID=1397264 RepID=UPI0026653350|nr:type II toxin-antitoxin system VapC family toxin [Catalinimonas niigatensis]WPP53000.1 type II toxin-antitoxin system VapC family toxin [Catalinimonas niigatensis]
MNVFFDTSSLFKLYHKESGTEELMDFFNNNQINALFLAEITRIEFASVVWKKCRKRDIDETLSKKLIDKFEFDSNKYSYVTDTPDLKSLAGKLIAKHWKEGLRTLDSIQLASALIVKEDIEFFFSADHLLLELAQTEGLTIR